MMLTQLPAYLSEVCAYQGLGALCWTQGAPLCGHDSG